MIVQIKFPLKSQQDLFAKQSNKQSNKCADHDTCAESVQSVCANKLLLKKGQDEEDEICKLLIRGHG